MRNSASAATVQENRPRITGRQATTRASVPLLLTWPASALAALIVLSGGNARSSAKGSTAGRWERPRKRGSTGGYRKLLQQEPRPRSRVLYKGRGGLFGPASSRSEPMKSALLSSHAPRLLPAKLSQRIGVACLLARSPQRTRGCSSISESTLAKFA